MNKGCWIILFDVLAAFGFGVIVGFDAGRFSGQPSAARVRNVKRCGDGATVARWSHKPPTAGATPAPANNATEARRAAAWSPSARRRRPAGRTPAPSGIPKRLPPRFVTQGRSGFLPPCPLRSDQSPTADWQSAIELTVIAALWAVETERGTNLRPGDGGAAHGHLQQHEGHWKRGCEYLGARTGGGLPVDWPWPEDAYDLEKARAIAIANWRRDAWPKIELIVAEELARRFRLPFDPYRASNDEYWGKVKTALATENAEVQR